MITRLDHIAIAVPDLSTALRRFCDDLGLTLAGQEDVPSARTTTAFLPGEGTRIELVHPLGGQGAIATFLEKRGGGLHHLCFETDDIEADVTRLRGLGYRFTTEAPTPGAHGTQVIFLHPKGFDGVLIELAQHPPAIEGVHP
jgi:methylmalonyl-CoA/ethylmalonyl-CoA epimerase